MDDKPDSLSSPALLEIDLTPSTASTAVDSGHIERLEREEERVEGERGREEEMVKVKEEEEDVRVLQQRMSNLELENNLLRQEVGSLSEEMSSVLQRNKNARESEIHFTVETDTQPCNPPILLSPLSPPQLRPSLEMR